MLALRKEQKRLIEALLSLINLILNSILSDEKTSKFMKRNRCFD